MAQFFLGVFRASEGDEMQPRGGANAGGCVHVQATIQTPINWKFDLQKTGAAGVDAQRVGPS